MATDSHLISFVREHVRSVWGLELLLLLRADAKGRAVVYALAKGGIYVKDVP